MGIIINENLNRDLKESIIDAYAIYSDNFFFFDKSEQSYDLFNLYVE